jgi:predicted O-methyltransferase YrrM
MLLPNATTMVEIGVQRGIFAHLMLETWRENKRYILVDSWKSEIRGAYLDAADSDAQDRIYHEAVNRIKSIPVSTALHI